MACWQTGERKRAQGCYDEAVRDAKSLAPASPLVKSFRAEAAARLGLPTPSSGERGASAP
jgi:hypothetical protein